MHNEAASLVCLQAIRGLNTSYLRDKAQAPPYRNEGVSWKMELGPDSSELKWMEEASLSIEVAKQILRISNGQPALTKEEQWQ